MNMLIRTSTKLPPLRSALILITAGFLALVPATQAVSPPPDGGYSGGNTAEGDNTLLSLTTGTYNTGIGWFSLRFLTSGQLNTGVGAGALLLNTGSSNTATGAGALLSNTGGQGNTANGVIALLTNSTGNSNTAIGGNALLSNTIGNANTAIGLGALQQNTTGGSNVALGLDALAGNTIGNGNTALGAGAGSAIGTANNVIAIHSPGGNVDNTTWVANVFGVTPVSGSTAPVVVSDTGQLGTLPSSRRFKRDIESMDKTSESILALKPVTFHYKSDSTNTAQFGLIAEAVAKVNPDLVARDNKGDVYTVRYDAVNAMLLNEFLKAHRTIDEQQVAIVNLTGKLETLTRRLNEQAFQLRKVSAQFNLSPVMQVVAGRQ
jgi:hypothetical protein